MPAEPLWLTVDHAIQINRRLVATSGEPHVVGDTGLLSSAIARPQNRWADGQYDMAELAGSLLLGIGRYRPFPEGNKRTALAAAIIFLSFNGYSFVAPDGEPLSRFIERSIANQISEQVFMSTMKQCTMTTVEWEAFRRSRES